MGRAANEVRVDFSADVRRLVAASKEITDAQNRIQRELGETARAATRADAQMEASATRAARASQRTARGIARTARETGVAPGVLAAGSAAVGRPAGPYDLMPIGIQGWEKAASKKSAFKPYALSRVADGHRQKISAAEAFAPSHSIAIGKTPGAAPYAMGPDWEAWQKSNKGAIKAINAQLAQPLTMMPAPMLGPAGIHSLGGLDDAKAQYIRETRSASRRLASGKIDLDGYNSAIEQSRQKLSAATKAQKDFIRSGVGLGTITAGYLSIASAISAIIAGFREAQRVRDEAGQRLVEQAPGKGSLAQIATSQEHYDSMLKDAETLRTQNGYDEASAYQTVFQLEQIGARDKIAELARLKELGIDAAGVARGIGFVQTNFGEGGGTAREIVNKMIAAAGYSPTLEVHNVAAEYAKAAGLWATMAAPGDDEGGLAATTVLSAGVENAGELMKSFASQVGRKRKQIKTEGTEFEGLQGLDLAFAIPELEERGLLTDAYGNVVDRNKFLEDANARYALQLMLEKQADIRQIEAEIHEAQRGTGTGADLFGVKLGYLGGDVIGANLRRQNEEGREAAEEARFGTINNVTQALYDYNIAKMTREGYAEPAITAWKGAASTLRMLGDTRVLKLALSDIGATHSARKDIGIDWNVPNELRPAIEAAVEGDYKAAGELLGFQDNLLKDDGVLSQQDQEHIARAHARYRNLRADGSFSDTDLEELKQVIMESATLLKEAAQEMKEGATERRIADGGKPRAPRPSAADNANGPLRTPGGAVIH